MFGRIIVYSVLQEGPGFPFFPLSIFKYIASGRNINSAMECLALEHFPSESFYVVKQVCNNSQFALLFHSLLCLQIQDCSDDCLLSSTAAENGELFEQSGCFQPLRVCCNS